MKTRFLLILMAVASTPTLASEAAPLCAAKRARIEMQIQEAQAAGRTRELSGLNRALAANKSRCSDAALTKERDARIKKALTKVEAREKSLAQAAREGNLRGMQDRRNKLDQANRELAEAERGIGQ
jgi:hypothetical protein